MPMSIQGIGNLQFHTIILNLTRVHIAGFSFDTYSLYHIVTLQIENVGTIGQTGPHYLMFPGEFVIHQTLRLQIFI